jgi:hypothetical protein
LIVAGGVLHFIDVPDDLLVRKLCGHLAPGGSIA